MSEKKRIKTKTVSYSSLVICLLLNLFIILPGTLVFCFLGFLMSGGYNSYSVPLFYTFIVGMIPYLIICPAFLLVSKKAFFRNIIITIIVHFIISNIYSILYMSFFK